MTEYRILERADKEGCKYHTAQWRQHPEGKWIGINKYEKSTLKEAKERIRSHSLMTSSLIGLLLGDDVA
jgi:hypothetical protein